MTTLDDPRVADTLADLHRQADLADRALLEAFGRSEQDAQAMLAALVADERADLRGCYAGHADHFLSVPPELGRFLYMAARAAGARAVVEFGTSMGLSTLYLAAAVRDAGGGRVIGTELEPGKAARARDHLARAGLDELVEIRVGDARETLADLEGSVDMVLLDGAFTLYRPVLHVVEPRLRPGAVIFAENAFAEAGDYPAYVQDPANGYCSLPLPIGAGRGNLLSVYIDAP